jgi:6-pyruvoyl-tetrahydropterin synthase
LAIDTTTPQPQDTDEELGALFLNNLMTLDCAIFDPSWGITGQSWHVDVTLSGALDECGFVHDFSDLKSLIRQTLKTSVDHALVMPVGSQSVHYHEIANGESWQAHAKTKINSNDSMWEYNCPKGAVYPIRCVAITQTVIEQEIAKLIRHRVPASVQEVKIKLRPETTDPTVATFRYTHGITGHQGLCQRLFHGHRSRVEVYVDNERRVDQEHYLTRELFGPTVHIATPKQVKGNLWECGKRGPSGEQVTLTLQGTMGYYEAKLPASHVFLVEKETSIECLSKQVAAVIAKRLKAPGRVKVVCFEGIDKGGIGLA